MPVSGRGADRLRATTRLNSKKTAEEETHDIRCFATSSAHARRRPRRNGHARRQRSGEGAEALYPEALIHPLQPGNAEVSVVSDGPLPLGPPRGTFIGVPPEE